MVERSTSTNSDGEGTESAMEWPSTVLPWQHDAWDRVRRGVKRGNHPHALLIAGSGGIGKNRFAHVLAALLLCHQAGADGACGQCRSCTLLRSGSHGDFLYLTTQGKSRVIKIEQVRDLIDFANQTAGLGRHKVAILNPAEVLNLNAANALLKCLEEPSAGTYLLLVSGASGTLPATIRSRCQQLLLAEPAREQACDWLGEAGDIDANQCNTLLELTGNRPLAARELLAGERLVQWQAAHQGLLAIRNGDICAVEFPQLVSDLELQEVLGLLANYLQAEIKQRLLVRPADLRRHFLVLDDLLRLQRAAIHGANPNRQLTIETSVAQLAHVLGARQE